MKNKKSKLLPYKLTIAILLAVVIGSVGYNANASNVKDDVLDRVADKIAEKILGSLDEQIDTPSEEQNLGWSTKDEIWLNNDSGVIYFDTSKGSGIRVSSGIMQCKNSGGTWAACSGATPGDEGWLADSSNNHMYPSTNASGDFYPLILGASSTSTPATADTELYVGGGGQLVATGNIWSGSSVYASSTLQATGDIWGYADLTVGSGARIGVGSTGGHITAMANDSLFVEGESEFDGAAYFDGALWASSTLAVTGNAQIVGTLTTVGLATFANASSTFDSVATALWVGGSNGLYISDGSILDVSGAISFGDETLSGSGNWTTTGNIAGANGTFSGSLTIDTNTLYVDNTNNAVGIGTTTPVAGGASLSVYDELEVFDATSPYDVLVELVDSDDDGIVNIYANNSITNKFHGNGTSYITAGTFGIGTTTSVAELSILEATNPQLRLAYDADNFVDYTLGSGGDLTIAASGGDISFSNENLSTTGKIGAGTSTPSATFSVGTSAAATTTMDWSKPCIRIMDEAGVQRWLRVNAAGTVSATTNSCE